MEIVQYCHPALRWKSKPILHIGPKLDRIVAEMFELMYASKGIGLAANQVALPYRVFILNLSGEASEKDEEIVFINPEIVRRRGTAEGEEGCLSFPGMYGQVKRSSRITVQAYNLKGEGFEYALSELPAKAVQHELDHLDGILFIDKLTDASKKDCEGMVGDFEKQFRRWQVEGKYPSDADLQQELMRLEKQEDRFQD